MTKKTIKDLNADFSMLKKDFEDLKNKYDSLEAKYEECMSRMMKLFKCNSF